MDAERMHADLGHGRRILMTADTVGGVWQFAMTLCRQLAQGGDRIALAALGPAPSAAQRAEAERIPGLTLHAIPSRLLWMDDPWDDIAASGERLLALERRLRPDLVHLNDFGHGTLPWRSPVLLSGHSCVLSWWQAVHGGEAPPEWRRYQRHVQAALRAAALVTAPTRAMLQALDWHYGPLPGARVVANGSEAPSRTPVKTETLVFAAGRVWDEGKNLAALAALAPALPWPVWIAGDGPHPGGRRRELPNVHLLGRLPPEAMAGWFARAPVYALPARYEPFGLSVLEAALAGCALVLGDIPSLREVWGEAALFVPPDDQAALREALLTLLHAPVLRVRMATRARLRAARYTPAAMAAGYRSAYADVLGSPTPSPRPAHAPVLPLRLAGGLP